MAASSGSNPQASSTPATGDFLPVMRRPSGTIIGLQLWNTLVAWEASSGGLADGLREVDVLSVDLYRLGRAQLNYTRGLVRVFTECGVTEVHITRGLFILWSNVLTLDDNSIESGICSLRQMRTLLTRLRDKLILSAISISNAENILIHCERMMAGDARHRHTVLYMRHARSEFRNEMFRVLDNLVTPGLAMHCRGLFAREAADPGRGRASLDALTTAAAGTLTDDEGEERLCPICQDTLRTDPEDEGDNREAKPQVPIVTDTCCGKPFHVLCLLTWFAANHCDCCLKSSCPNCRAPLLNPVLCKLLEMRIVLLNHL